MNKIKSVIFLAMSLPFCNAYADGALDGIYSCQVTWPNNNRELMYIAINSNPTTTVVSIPNVQNVIANGYILGAVASNTYFSGTSNTGYDVKIYATGNYGNKSLNLKGTLNSITQGPTLADATCSQFL